MATGREIAGLNELYAQLPTFTCKPGCTDCCGPVSMTRAEYERVCHVIKREFTIDKRSGACSLAVDGRCSIYKIRPMICRLFGVVEGMKCTHGGKPERLIPRDQGHMFLEAAEQISGENPYSHAEDE